MTKTPTTADGSRSGQLEATLTEAVLTTSRVLVGIAVHSVEAAPVNVTVTQLRVLVLLSVHGRLKINELADRLGVNQSNASRHCANLEESGLVTRRRSEADARAVEVNLTSSGRRLLESVDNSRRREIAEVVARLPAELLETAAGVFEQFNRAAGDAGDPAAVDGALREPT